MSMVSSGAAVCVCLHLLTFTLHSQAPAAGAGWKDPSPHRAQFVQVTPPVRLEVLDGSVGKGRMAAGGATLLSHMKKFATIPAPALLIYASPHTLGRWVDDSTTEPAVREQVKGYLASLAVLTDRQTKAIESSVPAARVVRLPGAHHYVYLSHEADVLREMRAFLGSLR